MKIALLFLAVLLTGCSRVSYGVIGGADGPTSIIVSGPNIPILPLFVVGLIVAAVIFAAVEVSKRNR